MGSRVCTDCQVESSELAFQQRLRQLERGGFEGLNDALRPLWWRRPFVPERRDDESDVGGKEESPDIGREDPNADTDHACPVLEITTCHEEDTPTGRHWLADALEIPERPAPPLPSDALARLIHRHLEWVSRDAPRRAIGCSVILLPEDEAKLAQEIRYYETTGQVMARARRQGTVNPRSPHPNHLLPDARADFWNAKSRPQADFLHEVLG